MNNTHMYNISKGDAWLTNSIFGNTMGIPREKRMHSLVELLFLPTKDILGGVTATQ